MTADSAPASSKAPRKHSGPAMDHARSFLPDRAAITQRINELARAAVSNPYFSARIAANECVREEAARGDGKKRDKRQGPQAPVHLVAPGPVCSDDCGTEQHTERDRRDQAVQYQSAAGRK